MIFTNLTWGLSYVHLQLGAEIVIRCMSEDSCRNFLSFWKVGLLLDIIVLPFLNCKQCWFCSFQGTGEPFFLGFLHSEVCLCLTICRQSALLWAKHANLSDRLQLYKGGQTVNLRNILVICWRKSHGFDLSCITNLNLGQPYTTQPLLINCVQIQHNV
jgi:hypothetical protein